MKIALPMPQVIAGFPGVGKSSFCKMYPQVSDSDSSKFDKAEFPANYIAHIKQLIAEGKTILVSTHKDVRNALAAEGKTILVSTHKDVRDALAAEGIPFALVYPAAGLKAEYLQRYTDRGSPQPFLDLMEKQFEAFQAECRNTEASVHIVLQADQGLGDVFAFTL